MAKKIVDYKQSSDLTNKIEKKTISETNGNKLAPNQAQNEILDENEKVADEL